MSWRVLELSEQPIGAPIPQLLIKPVFTPDSYIVHITCLSNIWSEHLHRPEIVDRAALQQSPIEVSKHDSTQLAILLDNIEKSLYNSQNATCRLTRGDKGTLALHTTIALPAPLGPLSWTFSLAKRSSIMLKNELILPLLISSHIQTEQINDLIITIAGKDRAITRLVNQFESSNMDLASAFPNIGAQKSGRRAIKREQAARHVNALRPFQEDTWREETGHLNDADVTTPGLFQEALVQCTTLKVPEWLVSEDEGDLWWNKVPSEFSGPAINPRGYEKIPVSAPSKAVVDPVEDETEDEFEVHEHFKTRGIGQRMMTIGDESTGDDYLDTPPEYQGRDLRRLPSSPRPRAFTPQDSYPLNPISSSPTSCPKGKGFCISGRKESQSPPSSSPPNSAIHTPSSQAQAASIRNLEPYRAPDVNKQIKKSRFKIGGKNKAVEDSHTPVNATTESTTIVPSRPTPTSTPVSPPLPIPVKEEPQSSQVEHTPEETAEEKAERKRAELKRKIEEAAKKQAQSKKKKRF